MWNMIIFLVISVEAKQVIVQLHFFTSLASVYPCKPKNSFWPKLNSKNVGFGVKNANQDIPCFMLHGRLTQIILTCHTIFFYFK